MLRKHRANNSGMHLMHGPQCPYGKCPICQQEKPIYWISRVDFLCHACLKKSGHKPFVPPLEPQRDIHIERPARMRQLPRHQQRSVKSRPTQQQKNKRKHQQKSPANTNSQESAHPILPDPEVQHTEQLRQEREQKRRELERQLAQQDDRPLIERIREYRRHRFLEDDASSS